MLRSYNKLEGFTVHATDGEIGHIRDFIFDEPVWAVRYADIDIGHWVPGKAVLLSTSILGPTALSTIDTKLSISQIENCPAIYPDEIPDRKYEEELHNYFSWSYYWAQSSDSSDYNKTCKLQRIKAIKGFHILTTDGEIGHLSDVLIDDIEWKIRYWVVDTGVWFFGKKVLVSPTWGGIVDDQDAILRIQVNREKIESAPSFDLSIPLTPEYETTLFAHYDKKPYWNDLK